MDQVPADVLAEIAAWSLVEPNPCYRFGEVCRAFDTAATRVVLSATTKEIVLARAITRYLRAGGDIRRFRYYKMHLNREQLLDVLNTLIADRPGTVHMDYIVYGNMVRFRADLAIVAVTEVCHQLGGDATKTFYWSEGRNKERGWLYSHLVRDYDPPRRCHSYNFVPGGRRWVREFVIDLINTALKSECGSAPSLLSDDFMTLLVNVAIMHNNNSCARAITIIVELDKLGAFCPSRSGCRHIGDPDIFAREKHCSNRFEVDRSKFPPVIEEVGRLMFSDEFIDHIKLARTPYEDFIIEAYVTLQQMYCGE